MVRLTSRLERAGDSGDAKAASDRAQVVLPLIGAEVEPQPAIEPLRAVPFQRLEVVSDRIAGLVFGDHDDRIGDRAAHPGVDVAFLQPGLKCHVIVVGPRRGSRNVPPRRGAREFHDHRERVEPHEP